MPCALPHHAVDVARALCARSVQHVDAMRGIERHNFVICGPAALVRAFERDAGARALSAVEGEHALGARVERYGSMHGACTRHAVRVMAVRTGRDARDLAVVFSNMFGDIALHYAYEEPITDGVGWRIPERARALARAHAGLAFVYVLPQRLHDRPECYFTLPCAYAYCFVARDRDVARYTWQRLHDGGECVEYLGA